MLLLLQVLASRYLSIVFKKYKALSEAEKIEEYEDGTRHFLRRIEEHGNRWLRVVINIQVQPNRSVTAFFDRRLKDKQ